PDTVLADYRRLEQGEEAPPLVTAHRPAPRDFPLGAFLAVVLLLALAAGAAWRGPSRSPDGLLGRGAPAARAPAVTEPAASTPAVTERAARTAAEPAARPVEAEPAPAGSEETAGAPGEGAVPDA